jgi:hypothetical protein
MGSPVCFNLDVVNQNPKNNVSFTLLSQTVPNSVNTEPATSQCVLAKPKCLR